MTMTRTALGCLLAIVPFLVNGDRTDGKITDYVVPGSKKVFIHVRHLLDRDIEVSLKVLDPQANSQAAFTFNSKTKGVTKGDYQVYEFQNPLKTAYSLVFFGEYKDGAGFKPCIARNNGTDTRGPFYQFEIPPENGGFNDIEVLVADKDLTLK
jgi:hypothetical protein